MNSVPSRKKAYRQNSRWRACCYGRLRERHWYRLLQRPDRRLDIEMAVGMRVRRVFFSGLNHI